MCFQTFHVADVSRRWLKLTVITSVFVLAPIALIEPDLGAMYGGLDIFINIVAVYVVTSPNKMACQH